MRVQIGVYYPDGKLYNCEEAETVGKPLTDGKVLSNRRNIRGKMNEQGKEGLELLKKLIKSKLGVVPVLSYSIYAGCPCPCSPGYKIALDLDNEVGERVRELFTSYGILSYYTGKYPNRYVVRGPRDVGIALWGEVEKGKVVVRSALKGKCEDNEKVYKAVRAELRRK